MSKGFFHEPVLLKETTELLNVRKGKRYIDATVGMGGHTAEILKRGGVVLSIDCDPEAIACCKLRFRTQDLILVRGNFKNLKKIAQKHGFQKAAGVFFDLGLSSWQIEKSGKGFSYLRDESLDMRMDPNLRLKAADFVNSLKKEELYEIFSKFGEEVNSRTITDALVSARPIKTTKQLTEVIGKDVGQLARVFQALRIAVNNEVDNLRKGVSQAIELLEKRGRLVVISFHSLEDRIVKFGLRDERLKVITKRPIRASREEVVVNPRSRSARLRVAERI